jgi:hypothetical protein
VDQPKNIQSRIAGILRKTGRRECLEKAALLENSEQNSSRLHLRNLGLLPEEVMQIASVFKEMERSGNFNIDSISFSYNHSLRDEGAVALIKSLPISIRELGLVNCGIGETGGQELYNWIKNAPNLKMICAEQNSFSDKLRSDFMNFSIQNPQIIVVV